MDIPDWGIYTLFIVGCLLYLGLVLFILRPAYQDENTRLKTCEIFLQFICGVVVVSGVFIFGFRQNLLSALICCGGAVLAALFHGVPLCCGYCDRKSVMAVQKANSKDGNRYW